MYLAEILTNFDEDRLYNTLVLGMEIFKMENTTKASVFNLHKTKISRAAVLILFAFVAGHVAVMEESFPVAAAFVSYMVYRNTAELYLVLPTVAGILPYISRGCDPWGDMAAVIVCVAIVALTKRAKLSLFQAGTVSAAVYTVCVSVGRLLTGTVYKTSPGELVITAVLLFITIVLLDVFFTVCRGSSGQCCVKGGELSVISAVSVCILVTGGINASFIIWPLIIFLALWGLIYRDLGAALTVTVVGSIWAALLGQAQWGFLATIAIGTVCAFPVKRLGTYLCEAVFILVCWALGHVEGGLVLGMDKYCLLLAAAIFAAVSWKFKKKMRKLAVSLCEAGGKEGESIATQAEQLIENRAAQMEEMAELYSTYLDSRSLLSNQFDIMGQIFRDTGCKLEKALGKPEEVYHEKFNVDIALSQCAAAGTINGDCCGWQDIGEGRLAMIVSDGMGKGKKAASESLMVIKTIMALLRSGATVDQTLKMINSVMLIKDDEDSYATVDLAIVDKRWGRVRFYKIGAAPTLIRRREKVEEVSLSAVPLGIVNGLKVRYMETSIKRGDWIIMMSDGVSDGGAVGLSREPFLTYLKEAASKIRSDDPKVMSRLLINHAADSYIGRERDDMTVMVAKIL